jgi:hypothetical protein
MLPTNTAETLLPNYKTKEMAINIMTTSQLQITPQTQQIYHKTMENREKQKNKDQKKPQRKKTTPQIK